MAKTITIFWKSNSQYEPLPFRLTECNGSQVVRREETLFLIIRQKENKRLEIPLDNVLYWSVDTVVTNDSVSDPNYDRYCNSCKTYFGAGQYDGHPIPIHDVRRTCCGTSPHNDHHPACTQDESEGNQRIGTITDISEDDNGLRFAANLIPGTPDWLERFFR